MTDGFWPRQQGHSLKPGSKVAISTMVAAVLSSICWLIFLLFAETATASDYRAGSAPGETPRLKMVAVLVTGPLVFAVGIVAWQRLEAAVLGDERRDA